MILIWLKAFLFTQAVEVLIYAWALRPRRWLARLAIAFGASLITHPIVFLGVDWGSQWGYWQAVAIAEVGAVAVEALYMHLWGVRRALLWSLTANGASLALGLLARYGWQVV